MEPGPISQTEQTIYRCENLVSRCVTSEPLQLLLDKSRSQFEEITLLFQNPCCSNIDHSGGEKWQMFEIIIAGL